MFSRFHAVLAVAVLLNAASILLGNTYDIELVREGAVIARKGPDTGSPSVIQVPSWIPRDQRANPEAEYYLYYCSDHREYICMKWAVSPTGPWHEFDLGGIVQGHQRRGVFDLLIMPHLDPRTRVASVDVHVDHDEKQIVMLYYGIRFRPNQAETVLWDGIGLVATSHNGLNFHPPTTAGGQPGHGPQMVEVEGKTRELWLGPASQSAFQHRGHWYSVSQHGILARAATPTAPWTPNQADPWDMAWQVEATPDKLWREDAANIQSRYISPAATFLASKQFAQHLNNPHPGTRLASLVERIDQVSVCVLPHDQLEIFFCIREELGDHYNGIYRVVLDIRSPDFQNWNLARNAAGEVLFEVVLDPETIRNRTRAANPRFDPIYHADPVSLGDPYLFVDQQGQKLLFFSYESNRYGGYEGRGQISAVRLIPTD